MGYSPWGRKESDMTEGLTHTHRIETLKGGIFPSRNQNLHRCDYVTTHSLSGERIVSGY